MEKIERYLERIFEEAILREASDIHFSVGRKNPSF
jgi:type II secretory ATPase GspE/PulE/Tfp pilus assembly ATPase PilB-like protein